MLVVIDLQPYFCAAKHIMPTCVTEMQKAMKRKEHIVVVEYKDCGWSLPELTATLQDYRWQANVVKNNDDGAYDIYKKVIADNIPFDNIKVCGINTSACVAKTVKSMAIKWFPKTEIQVLSHACHDEADWLHEDAIKELSKLPTVKVI